jgi:predicted exporter
MDRVVILGLIALAVLVMIGTMSYAVYFYRHCPHDHRVVTTPFGLACVRR